MIELLVYLIVVALVIGIVFWLVDYIPLQEPLGRWVKIVAVVIGALVLISVLLSLTGVDIGFPRRTVP